MQSLSEKNIHIPLSGSLYAFLKEEAQRTRQSMSQLARRALSQWLEARQKASLHREIVQYASSASGQTDLDTDLEAASMEHLIEEELRDEAR